ncbi:NEDD8-activating enzyme E1 regulatory subunit [Gracilaria domingensis]|nr:NEDD8-activating enzyme E1 regulatory subunit [Gracilaria domingensis]
MVRHEGRGGLVIEQVHALHKRMGAVGEVVRDMGEEEVCGDVARPELVAVDDGDGANGGQDEVLDGLGAGGGGVHETERGVAQRGLAGVAPDSKLAIVLVRDGGGAGGGGGRAGPWRRKGGGGGGGVGRGGREGVRLGWGKGGGAAAGGGHGGEQRPSLQRRREAKTRWGARRGQSGDVDRGVLFLGGAMQGGVRCRRARAVHAGAFREAVGTRARGSGSAAARRALHVVRAARRCAHLIWMRTYGGAARRLHARRARRARG